MSTSARNTPTPGEDFEHYLRSFPEEMAFSDEDPESILDRYCTADFVHHNDGIVLDREKLVAHARPVRKNAVRLDIDLRDVLVSGDRVAARYTMHSTMRKGRLLSTEVLMFGLLAPDGRLRRIDSLTSTLKQAEPE